jgi:hypothetical protein
MKIYQIFIEIGFDLSKPNLFIFIENGFFLSKSILLTGLDCVCLRPIFGGSG